MLHIYQLYNAFPLKYLFLYGFKSYRKSVVWDFPGYFFIRIFNIRNSETLKFFEK